MNKEYHVLIDDCRNLNVDKTYRSSSDVDFNVLKSCTHLYMDNDMGENSKEGHEILSEILSRGILPKFVFLVTSNPVCRIRMENMLVLDNGYTKINAASFELK